MIINKRIHTMRRFNSILILSSALVMASCGQKKSEQSVVIIDETPKVTVTKVNAENVPQLSTYPTTVEAEIVNNITPQSASRINQIFVEIGDHVNAGQKLATMDAISLEKLKLQMKNDSIEYGRTKELYEIGAVSQANFETMTLAYEVSKKTYSNLLENTILTSPISGIITARNYDEGDMYAMAQPLFVVQNITPVKMLINISENNYSKVKKGMEVDIVADAFPGETFKGKVNLVYPTIDSRTHTFPVEIIIDNKDEKLRPGMFARVTVNYGTNYRVVVPDNAVLKQVGADEKYVFVVNEDNTVSYTPVKLGVRMGDKYEVISGIDDGATVVTTGQTRLKNNIKVDIVK
ncbi:MAG: efflux RND transporter periplasmic adaptor subunit [Bacteroidales bacterium]|nr:efflux RND transporter periplasmic adaptor subunit [Bacteroidales bacterium]